MSDVGPAEDASEASVDAGDDPRIDDPVPHRGSADATTDDAGLDPVRVITGRDGADLVDEPAIDEPDTDELRGPGADEVRLRAGGSGDANAPFAGQGEELAADPDGAPADHPHVTAPRLTGRVVSERAAILHLDTERDGRDVRVTATLEHGGRSAAGVITTVPTTHGQVRAVAEATIAALRELVGPDLIAGVDRISVQPADDPANVIVTVGLVTDRGEETLLGTSIVRGDPDRAVMRATLDALNRRVAELFPRQPTAPGGSAA